MNREELLEVLYAACGADLDGRDAIKMADAVLQHLASQRQEQGLGACDICWTVSWEPIPDEAECRLKHPHEKDHVRCAMCWMTAQATQARAQAAAQGEEIKKLKAFNADGDGNFWQLSKLLEEKSALVARLGESLKWDHNTQGPNHVRSSCDVCALLAEIAPTTPTP